MSLWEWIKEFFRKLFNIVRDVTVEFFIEKILEVLGASSLLAIFIVAITRLGKRFSSKVFFDKRSGYVTDTNGNIIGYIDKKGNIVLHQYAYQYAHQYQ